jgi:predicted RNA-binding protein YlxR (DUF448 family)
LVRIVRTSEGVVIDLSGKQPGRGAYVCRQATCWQEALRKGRLDAALKTKLSADDRLKLTEFVASLGALTV